MTDSLAAGQSGELVFTATVVPWLTNNTITNTAGITSSTRETAPANNQESLTTTVINSADLSLSKTASIDAVQPGRFLTYTLRYSNSGPSDAHEVYITDTLPISVAWDGSVLAMEPPLAGPVQGADTEMWVWYTPTLPAGESGVITFSVLVSDSLLTPQNIVNQATAAHSNIDGNPGNNQDSVSTLVISPAIQLAKTVYAKHNNGNDCDRAGDSVVEPRRSAVTYCFKVTNTGDTYLDDITIADPTLGITQADMTPIGASTLPLPAGDSLTYYYETEVVDALVNTALVEGNPTDASGVDLSGVTSPTDSDTAMIILPPAPPSGLSATPVSESQVDLAWVDNSDDEDGFRVERSPDGTTGWTAIFSVTANVTSHSDIGLPCSTAYYYRVAAFRDSDGSLSSYTDIASAATFPCAPTALSATAVSETQINLAWTDNASDETAFRLDRWGSGVSASYVITLAADITATSDPALLCSTTYSYTVSAFRAGDNFYSAPSNLAQARTSPCAPSGLTATLSTTNQIDLQWTDNANDESEFRVERSANGVDWTEILTTTAGVTSTSDPGVVCSTYYYRLRAYRETDVTFSSYSNIVSATLPTVCPPTALAVSPASETEIDLSWTDNANDETAFRIERASQGLAVTQVITLSADVTTTTDSGLACGTTYSYTVAAFRATDKVYSTYTAVISATTSACPSPALTGGAHSDIAFLEPSRGKTAWVSVSPDLEKHSVCRSPIRFIFVVFNR